MTQRSSDPRPTRRRALSLVLGAWTVQAFACAQLVGADFDDRDPRPAGTTTASGGGGMAGSGGTTDSGGTTHGGGMAGAGGEGAQGAASTGTGGDMPDAGGGGEGGGLGGGGFGGSGPGPGSPCQSSQECPDGLSCVDAICCTQTCANTCEACVLEGMQTVCKPDAVGTDPDNACMNGEKCSGYALECTLGWNVLAEQYGDAQEEAANAVAVSGAGDMLLGGHYQGDLDLGNGKLGVATGQDAFVARLDKDAKALWSKAFGGAANQGVTSVAFDSQGNALVAGESDAPVDLGGGVLAHAGGKDIFVAKLDPQGKHLWSKSFGAAQDDVVRAVAVDPSGEIVITGGFEGTVDFGSGGLASAGKSDIFVVKLDAAGNTLWAKRYGDSGEDMGVGVAFRSALNQPDNVVVAAYFRGTVTFTGLNPPDRKSNGGSEDVLLFELKKDGSPVRAFPFGDAQDGQRPCGVATDPLGNLVLAGNFKGSITFQGKLTAAGSSSDVFVVRLYQSGLLAYERRYGDPANEPTPLEQLCTGVAVDDNGSAVVVGYHQGKLLVDGKLWTSAGGDDLFALRLDPQGTPVWSHGLGDAANQRATAVAVHPPPTRDAVVVGSFEGTLQPGQKPLTAAGASDIFLGRFDGKP